MFKELHKKTKVSLSIGLVLAFVSVALYVGGYAMLQREHSKVKDLVLQSKQEALETKQLQSTRHLINDTQEQRERLNKYFITADEIVSFIEQIESLGEFTGVSFELNSVDVIDADADALLLKFTTRGSWEKTYRLLALIESLPYNIDVERVRVLKESSVGRGSEWRGDFNIRLDSFINQ